MNIWTEHRNPEGRTYWFNTATKESVWEKPDELKTPFERALNQTPWKEYFSGGRKYFYNTETKESKWDMPDEVLLVLEKVEKEKESLSTTDPVSQAVAVSQPAALNGTDGAVGPHTGGLPFAPSSILPARPNLPDDPIIPHNGFATLEEGEKAFVHLLKKAGVDANWTWDQTMRAIITDPLYKALNTLAEKKAAWQKFTDALKAKEQDEKESRLSKLRPALRNMLKGNPNVSHYTTFATADKLFSQHPIWQQAKIEAERKIIFEEYAAELKQREVLDGPSEQQDARAARARSISKLVTLFKQLGVDVTTRWRTAHALVLESEEWERDSELRKLPTLDILLAFEDYSRVREREFEEQMRRAQVEKTRRERKAREAFKDLLQSLVQSGAIKARTKWKQIYPYLANDERYANMLGNPGSNPLELFWDIVDRLDQELDVKLAMVKDAVQKHRSRPGKENGKEDSAMDVDEAPLVGPNTTFAEFETLIQVATNEMSQRLADDELSEVFSILHDQTLKKQADERRRVERKQRHLQDDLRYALKKLPDPLDISLSYEDALPLIEHLPEYKALDDDEGRRAAFMKFVKRQKERLREQSEDGGSTTSRKRREPAREHREPERDKEREQGREREQRERERDRDRDRGSYRERGKEHEKEGRGSRHYHRGHDDHDSHGHRSSHGELGRERDIQKEGEKERERDASYRSSKHHREEKRKSSRLDHESAYADYEEPVAAVHQEERERSNPVYREEARDKRDGYEDRNTDERAEKRPRLDAFLPREGEVAAPRAETPEEGEI